MLPLIELLRAVSEPLEIPPSAATISITGLCMDSRSVQPGNLFFALKGEHSDGAAFIPQALEKGAVVVISSPHRGEAGRGAQFGALSLSSPPPNLPPMGGGINIYSQNPMLVMAQMAARFYGAQPAHMAAVTGTDGKTSTADFFRQFWHGLGQGSASIGTLGVLSGSGDLLVPESRTTPYPIELHQTLADLAAKEVPYACLEASSHGLHQYRLHGVNVEAAAFTNIARDHLDYHKTEEEYFKAKLRLFSELLPEGKTAVINQDDSKFHAIKAVCDKRKHKVIGFGFQGGQFTIKNLTPLPHGQRADVQLFGKNYSLEIPLVGAFQVMNILAALGLVVGTGGDLAKALAVIPNLKGVPGRLEQVALLANGVAVFIDYAHTPAALANILRTLRPHTVDKLHVLFGCGGDRDKGKRPEMGKIASELADHVIVTDDNPRSEDPKVIRSEILAASPRAKEVADRKEAIYVALKALGAGDILVLAGKGHEKTQIIGKTAHPFDDAEVTRDIVKELNLA